MGLDLDPVKTARDQLNQMIWYKYMPSGPQFLTSV